MRFLLMLAIVAGSSPAMAGATVAVKGGSYLASIHQLVASGYVLYEAQLPSALETVFDLDNVKAKQGAIFLFQDKLADGSSIISKTIYKDDQTDQLTSFLHTDGVFSQESEMVNIATVVLYGDIGNFGTISLLGSYGLKRANDSLLRASWHEGGFDLNIGFEQSKNYRVYRGQQTIDSENGNPPVTVTETITINGYNPYVIFRHTSWKKEDEQFKDEELSIGTYPFLAINPFKVDAKIIKKRQSSTTEDNYYRPVLADADISYNFDGLTLSELGEGEVKRTIDLQLVKDSDIWLEFEGNPGFTGAGLASLLVQQLRDKGKTKEAEIAEQLFNELDNL